MPKRQRMLDELKNEQDYGVLLMVQMDAIPETLQLIVATTQYDEKAGGLLDRGKYVVRALSVREHKVSVGLFGNIQIVEDHPLLYQYNTTPAAVFFRGKPDNANELLMDIMQAHSSTFGAWRQFPLYMNIAQPLITLLNSGGGLLGEMPRPLADRMIKVLEHHGLETKLVEAESDGDTDEHGRSRLYKALMLDDSYFVALDFSVEELGKV